MQTQLENAAAIRLARLDLFKLDYVYLEGIGLRRLIMLTDGARRFQRLKWEIVLA
jgi:hypothetical protein